MGVPAAVGRTARGSRDSSIDVGEAIEAAHRRQARVDRRRCQASVFHPASVQLDVGPGRGEHGEVFVGCPLEEAAEIVAVGLERSAVVAGQERDGGKLGALDREGLPYATDPVGKLAYAPSNGGPWAEQHDILYGRSVRLRCIRHARQVIDLRDLW